MSSISVFAQKSIITGKVVDGKGESLIGVNVLVKGTTTGTVTDLDGKYSISAPTGSTLSFTYIGFTSQDIKVTNQKSY
jgi:hypothetical protein